MSGALATGNTSNVPVAAENRLQVGVIGAGAIGGGLIEHIKLNSNLPLDLALVASLQAELDAKQDLLEGIDKTTDAYDIINNPDVDVVVELVGGTTHAYEFVKAALEAGKHVVTANKALLAKHGVELAKLAEENGVTIGYEAAIGGGIHFLNILRQGFGGTNISSIEATLNGTCGYILKRMYDDGLSFEEALQIAVDLEYVEKDQSLDLDAIDPQQKLSILPALLGIAPDLDGSKATGIRNVSSVDIEYAKEHGYKIALLCRLILGDENFQVVEPSLAPEGSTFHANDGVVNAVRVASDRNHNIFAGPGAGPAPTAAAVVGDLLNIQRGHFLPVFGKPVDEMEPVIWNNPDERKVRLYTRFNVHSNPEARETVQSILEANGISVAEIEQKEGGEDDITYVLVVSDNTSKAEMMKATEAIASELTLGDGGIMMPIEPAPE